MDSVRTLASCCLPPRSTAGPPSRNSSQQLPACSGTRARPAGGGGGALEERARIARGAGAVRVAGAALGRAGMLPADPRRKGERLVRAAELVYDLGRGEVVSRLLREAESLELGPLESA